MTSPAMATEVPTARPAPPAGALSPGSWVHLLRTLHLGRETGILHLSRGGEKLSLRFIDGHVVSGSQGPVGRLGEILARCGVVSRLDLDRSLEKAALEGRRLGPILVEEGLASREQVQEALRLQVRDVLFTVFFWGFGAYRFEPDQGPAFSEEINLEISTSSLLLEVVSCLESPETLRQGLGDLDQPVVVAKNALHDLVVDRAKLSPGDGYVLSRADGSMTMRQIIETAPLPAPVVEKSLLGLLCAGALDGTSKGSARGLPLPDETIALSREQLLSAGERCAAERREGIEEFLRGLQGKSHFEVLGLRVGASPSEVKDAYLRLAKRFHPDVSRDPAAAPATKAVFLRVSEAYNILGSPDSRARYEERLGLGLAPAELPGPAIAAPSPEEAKPLPEPGEAVRQAEELIAEGKLFEAVSLLDDVVPHMEGRLRQRARLLRIRAYLKTPSGAHPAESELREVLEEAPDSIEACLLLGGLYRDHGLSRRAASYFGKVLELSPDHPQATAQLRTLPLGDNRTLRVRARA